MIKPPRPTEYRGIVFRSKTEAITARALDLSLYQWEYEPKQFESSDGWVPDFWCYRKSMDGFVEFVMEVKPCRPTETYKSELANRFRGLPKTHVNMMILYGSPFDVSIPRGFEILRDWGWENHPGENRMSIKWDEAKRYRFDLKSY